MGDLSWSTLVVGSSILSKRALRVQNIFFIYNNVVRFV